MEMEILKFNLQNLHGTLLRVPLLTEAEKNPEIANVLKEFGYLNTTELPHHSIQKEGDELSGFRI